MNITYLLLGGNQGDRQSNLDKALELIEEKLGIILQRSPIYQTAAWGKTDQADFLNQAIAVQTIQDAYSCLDIIQEIEAQLGRQRIELWGARSLDIDILFFNDSIINSPDLIIPHPHLQDRRFVLAPLCAIAPTLVHPVFQQSILSLLEHCSDPLAVTPF